MKKKVEKITDGFARWGAFIRGATFFHHEKSNHRREKKVNPFKKYIEWLRKISILRYLLLQFHMAVLAESCNTFVNRIFPTVKCRRLPLITSMKKCWRLLLIAQTSKLNSVDGVASQFYFYLDPYHSNG